MADKCELSGSYKEVYLTDDQWRIESTHSGIAFDTICGTFAYKKGYLAYKHDNENEVCHMIHLVNRLNITFSEEKLPEQRISVDSVFIKNPLTGLHELYYRGQVN